MACLQYRFPTTSKCMHAASVSQSVARLWVVILKFGLKTSGACHIIYGSKQNITACCCTTCSGTPHLGSPISQSRPSRPPADSELPHEFLNCVQMIGVPYRATC